MISSWRFVFRNAYNFSSERYVSIPIPLIVSSNALIIGFSTNSGLSYLGRFVRYPFVDGFGFVRAETLTVVEGYQCWEFRDNHKSRVEFEPASKLLDCVVSVWVSNMPMYPGSVTGFSNSVTPSTVPSATTNTVILAANASRKGALITNSSTSNLYLEFGANATTTSYSVAVLPGYTYEVPFNWLGVINGVWSSANGNATVREFL